MSDSNRLAVSVRSANARRFRLKTAITSGVAAATLLLASIPSSVLPAEPTLPIFDTHLHYNAPAWTRYSPTDVARMLTAANVPRALVSSTPDGGTLRLYQESKTRFVPILRPYRDGVTKYNWYFDPQTPGYVATRLARGIYKGIGEFHFLTGLGAATPTAKRVADLAVKHNLVLHVHSPALGLHTLFRNHPKLRILWAHAGRHEPAGAVRKMLDRYQNLLVELSLRERDLAPRGKLAPTWRALFERHPERFMVGSDTYSIRRWRQYRELIDGHRRWLTQLRPDIAVAIAYGNAVRVFGSSGVLMR